ncbi:MAG: DUF790 family protein [Polyangiaceae bacterium]
MLTSDLVRARRREGALHAQYVTGEAAARVLPIARGYVDVYRRMIGRSREELDVAAGAIDVSARDRLTALGLRKVLDDRCVFEGQAAIDPEEVRREVFLASARAWRDLDVRAGLDRAAVIASAASKFGCAPEVIEASLFADLRSAEILREAWDLGAEALVERYNLALAQSVLLRATRVTVTLTGESPDRYRRLFRAMRFLGLLHTVTLVPEPLAEVPAAKGRAPKGSLKSAAPGPVGGSIEEATVGRRAARRPKDAAEGGGDARPKKTTKKAEKKGSRRGLGGAAPLAEGAHETPVTPALPATYCVVIDGPFSLFGPSQKYGLRLATLLHAVLACERWSLIADVAWGARKEPLVFRVSPADRLVPYASEVPSSSPSLDAFVAAFDKLGSKWSVAPNDRIFAVPGEPAVIPDLAFVNRVTGEEVMLESFGFWSRAAVWTRVEQIRRGAIPARLLLAISKELRVSAEVLEDDDAGEVYVYKATMLPRAVLERLEKKGKAA